MTDVQAWLWATPNSNRVSILLEELGLAYGVHPVNIRTRAQFAPEILALNPFGKIPIVAWRERGERRVLFESGAILLHFAETFGQMLPSNGKARDETLAWLMVVLTGLGPMSGQAHHWTALAPDRPEPAIRHSITTVERIYRLLDERLADHMYLSDAYSVADIAAYPWIARHDWTTINIGRFPNLARWLHQVGERPGVQRGMRVPEGARLE